VQAGRLLWLLCICSYYMILTELWTTEL
jgi:hypothetical protein